ncbi:MAG: hypothetical protein IIX28_04100 [Clostridia bacterium]|nr:hypothetical protein [Clostridia bacterium]
MMNFTPQSANVDSTASWIYLGLGIFAIVAIIFVVAVFIPWLQDFRRELRYLNIEISRTQGREKLHWVKRKKKLIRSILPFFHYHGH